MEENKREEEYGSDIKIQTPFIKKLENFWYHYKWHSIAALFLVVAVLICSLQMCAKETVDFHLMYAGSVEISRKSVDGDIPAYNQITTAIGDYVDDIDGDGKKNVAFTTYFSLSPDEIKEIEGDPGREVNYTLLTQDADAMKTRFSIGEYYLCFVSPYVYEQYKGSEDAIVFREISQYAPSENSLEYYNDRAVKLSSTAFYKNTAAIRNNLPEDTLVVIRTKSAVASAFGSKENDENFARAEEVLRRILAE